MATEKKTWTCRSCDHEVTPRCPACRVVITGQEAEAGRCNMCGSPITAAIYTCPECQVENALRPPADQRLRPWRGRDLGVKGLQALRLIVGMIQMAGLIMLGVSCSAAAGGAEPPVNGPSFGQLQFMGFAALVGLIPVQIIIARVIRSLSFGTVTIGERRRRNQKED